MAKTGRPPSIIADEPTIISRYIAGESSASLAKDTGIANSRILSILRKNNIPVRSCGPKRIDILLEQLSTLYTQGLSHAAIAKKFNVSTEYVRKRLLHIIRTPSTNTPLKPITTALPDGMHHIPRTIAQEFLQQYHYLKSMPFGATPYGWIKQGKLHGVAVIGTPSRQGIYNIVSPENKHLVAELRRFCIRDAHKNDASWMLSRVLKLYWHNFPNKEIVVSYADSAAGHTGTIYRATNATYFGTSPGEILLCFPNGERLTPGMIRGRTIPNLSDAKVELSHGKSRYAFFKTADSSKKCLWKEETTPISSTADTDCNDTDTRT